MTTIARRDEPTTLAVVPDHDTPPSDPTGGRLVAWAESMQAAHTIGSALCQTAFAPTHFKGKPDDAAAAIMYGDEIGLTPTQALRSIFVVSGTPGLYARQMVALVLAKGHEVWVTEKTDGKVTVAGRRRGTTHVHEETWTVQRAQKAGYTNNKKYLTDPQAMLYARAASDVCRTIAPDALAGLAYSVEELEVDNTPTTRVRRDESPAPRKTAQRANRPEPAEPDLEPADTPPASPADDAPPPDDNPQDEPGITPAQSRLLHASYNDAGINERQDRLDYAASIIGHPIDTSNDLTKTEASKVIDTLVQLKDRA